MLSNVHLTECLGGMSACVRVCGGMPIFWLHTSTVKFTLRLSVCVCACVHGRGWVWVVLPRALCSSRESDPWPPHSTPSQALSTLYVGMSEYVDAYVCFFESNVLYVWVETGLFALSALCLHMQHIQYSPDVTLGLPLSVFVRVYDTRCTHWAILWSS